MRNVKNHFPVLREQDRQRAGVTSFTPGGPEKTKKERKKKMTPQLEILNQMIALTGMSVEIGELTQESGFCAKFVRGQPDRTFMDKSSAQTMPIKITGVSGDQETAIDGLFSICNSLSGLRAYPSGTGWELLNISVGRSPAFVQKQDNGKWSYSCILNVQFYLK